MTKPVRDSDGRKLLNMLKEKYHDSYTEREKKFIGYFGVINDNRMNLICWVVSDRKDRRHGVVDRPAPKDPYCEDLFDSMFRKW